MNQNRSHFMIVDGHGVIYRAYHAFPPLTSPEGMLVNAVYGFARILLTAIDQYSPEYIAVAFDHKKPTLRAQEYAEYKAHRPKMPDDLRAQIDIVKEVVTALNIPQFELEGYEADDLIGTVTQRVIGEHRNDVMNLIVTGDKDLLQLVDDDTHVWMPARGKFVADKEYDSAGVKEKMGVEPKQIPDLKALMGDTSDNIPGVQGVGPKTAAQLITTFGSLEKVYERVTELQADPAQKDSLIKGGLFDKLVKDVENAALSKKLATIERNVPIEFKLEPCLVSDYDKTIVIDLFTKLDFKSLIPLLPEDAFEAGVQDALF